MPRSDALAVDDAHAADVVFHAGRHEAIQPLMRLVFGAAVQVQNGLWPPFAAPQTAQQIGAASRLQEFAGLGVGGGGWPAPAARRWGFLPCLLALRVGAPLAQQAFRDPLGASARTPAVASQRLYESHGLPEQGPVLGGQLRRRWRGSPRFST